MSDSLERHPNIATYWLVLRIMACASLVAFIGFGGYGVWFDLSETQAEALADTQQLLGWVVLIYAGISQGCEFAKAWRQ